MRRHVAAWLLVAAVVVSVAAAAGEKSGEGEKDKEKEKTTFVFEPQEFWRDLRVPPSPKFLTRHQSLIATVFVGAVFLLIALDVVRSRVYAKAKPAAAAAVAASSAAVAAPAAVT
jgi:hypothetical protein